MKKTDSVVNFFSKLFSNSEKNVEEKIDLTKYRLKYEAIYEFKEIENVFYKFLETEYNNYPLDYIRDCRERIKEKMTDTEAIAATNYLFENYIDVKSPKELNLSGKERMRLFKDFEESQQLKIKKWVLEKSCQQIFNKIKDTMIGELGSDNYPRFMVSDHWKEIQKNYAGNDKVMEKLKIYDFDDGKKEEETFNEEEENQKVEIIVAKIETPKVFQKKEEQEKEKEEFVPDKAKAQQCLKSGIEFFKNKEYKEAYDEFTLAIKHNDKLKEAYFNRGVLNFNLKRYLESIKDMYTVLDFDPKNGKAYSVRGMCLKNLGHYEQAIEDLMKSHEIETLPKNFMIMGVCYDQLDQIAKAIENYELYLKHDSTSKNAMSVYHNRAHIFFQINRFPEAVESFSRAIEICENKEWIKEMRIMRAKSNEKLGIFNKEDEIKFEDLDINEQYNIALKHYKAEEYQKGYELFSKIADIQKHENSYYLLGMCAYYLEIYDVAIQNLKKSCEINPTFEKPLIQLASFYAKKRLKKKALNYYNLLIQARPSANHYFDRSNYLLSIDKKQEALDDLATCIELEPTMDDAYYSRGMIYFKDEDYEKALKDFDKTLELTEDPDIYCDRAVCHFYLDHLEQAKSDCQKSLEIDEDNERALNLLEQIDE
jgi:tetratricopeptide (TPR) repeat protein